MIGWCSTTGRLLAELFGLHQRSADQEPKAEIVLIPFNVIKVAQASAVLLKQESRRCMGRMRLLKLLYIADREALAQFRRPITGDRAAAMKNGPVLSRTYDLIKGQDVGVVEWGRFLESDRHMVLLREDPGNGRLSRAEIAKLQEVYARYADTDDWELSEATHAFAEWLKNKPEGDGSNMIPLDDLLEAVGAGNDRAALLEQGRAEQAFDRAFGA